MTEKKPAVPDVLGEVELDRDAPDFKEQFAGFARGLEGVLAEYQVEEYVIARKDDGSKMHLVVFPASSEPSERAKPGEKTADDSGVQVATAKKASGIMDSVERAKRTTDLGPKDKRGALDGLGPSGGVGGVGIRRKG